MNILDRNNERRTFNIEDSQLIGDVKEIHNTNSLLNVKKDQKVEFLKENASCQTSKLKNVLEKSQKDVINDILQPENIGFGYSKSNSSEEPKEQLEFSNEQLMFQRISTIPNTLKLTTIQNCEKHINTSKIYHILFVITLNIIFIYLMCKYYLDNVRFHIFFFL